MAWLSPPVLVIGFDYTWDRHAGSPNAAILWRTKDARSEDASRFSGGRVLCLGRIADRSTLRQPGPGHRLPAFLRRLGDAFVMERDAWTLKAVASSSRPALPTTDGPSRPKQECPGGEGRTADDG
ncbi:MAG: hypothetical protein M1826_003886 [Phylliscum demangeonii]|nr:MAG: hypothetical protein M1826_003886 [Phylliscum demangeonii]